MTAVAADLKVRTPAEMRRSRRLGIVYIVLALMMKKAPLGYSYGAYDRY